MDTGLEESLRSAQTALAQGRLAECWRECRSLLERAPRDADVLHLAAIVEFQQGNAAAALDLIGRAIASRPGDPRQHQSRGQMLKASGRPREAQADFRRVLELDPDFPEALASVGVSLLEAGDAESAREHLSRAVLRRPQEAEYRYNLALAQSKVGDVDEAIAALRQALALRPGFAQAADALGNLLFQRGEPQAALEAFTGALRADPSLSGAHNNLGNVLLALGRPVEAEQSLRAAIALNPGHSHAWNNLGNALRKQGRLAEAEAAMRAATERDPPLPLAWVNRGNVLHELDRIEEALGCFRHALQMHPDLPKAHVSAAIAHLLVGNLAEGWKGYRWRHGDPGEDPREAVPRHAKQGGLVALEAEQGLGDILFFLRWAASLKAAGARLAFRGDPRVHALLAPSGLFEDLAAASVPVKEGALRVMLGDLPLLGLESSPHPPPYALRADAQALERARRTLEQAGPAPYIGVAWKSGVESASEERLAKSVPVRELGAALRRVAGTVVSLQRDPGPEDTAALAASLGREVVDRAGANGDLEAMLALLGALDDYAGVSSTNVHMVAGLGKQARILVPVPPEWRYGRSGDATPWFPGFRLYREGRESGWAPALAQLVRDLAERHGSR